MTTEERVRAVVVDQSGVEPEAVVPAAKLMDDLDLDSLDVVELVMALEETFGFDIEDEKVENMDTMTFSDLVAMVESYMPTQ